MAQLATIAAIASIAGTVISAKGTLAAGKQQQTAANFEAKQMDQQAGQERAASQRDANEQRRRARFAQSRATALAGASGAGVADPTVVNILGEIDAEGEYNALSALYEGEERARGLQTGAEARRYEGASAKRASKISAAGTILSGAGSTLLARYG